MVTLGIDIFRMNNWVTCRVEEILPMKFLTACIDRVKEGWYLSEVSSRHESGFTVHIAIFQRYEKETNI